MSYASDKYGKKLTLENLKDQFKPEPHDEIDGMSGHEVRDGANIAYTIAAAILESFISEIPDITSNAYTPYESQIHMLRDLVEEYEENSPSRILLEKFLELPEVERKKFACFFYLLYGSGLNNIRLQLASDTSKARSSAGIVQSAIQDFIRAYADDSLPRFLDEVSFYGPEMKAAIQKTLENSLPPEFFVGVMVGMWKTGVGLTVPSREEDELIKKLLRISMENEDED